MPARHPDARLRLGIIGAGRVTADHHLPALRRLPKIEVAALADVDADRLQQTAGRFAIPGRCADPHALLVDRNIQAVAICTPPSTHTGLALAALAAGKHVFIEKPLALSLRECDQIHNRAASLPQLQVRVGFNQRCHRLMAAARRIVQSGGIGAVQSAHLTFTGGFHRQSQIPGWRTEARSGGGVVFELGSHAFDLARFLLAGEFVEVFALAPLRGDAGATMTIDGRLDNGTQVSILIGDHTADALEVDVFGDAGRLHVSGYRFDGLERWPVSVYPGASKVRAQRLLETLIALPSAWPSLRRGGDFADSYHRQWQRFAASVQNGVIEDAPTLDDGRQSLRAALACLYSLHHRRPASLIALSDESLDAGLG